MMDDHGIEQAFCIPLRLAMCRAYVSPSMLSALCEAYNDYVHDRYAKISDQLRPVALLPFQDPERAVVELRRAVRELGCRGAVVRTTGLRLPLGHKFYDPIYREAESLGCALAVHGTNGAEELASGAFETFTEVHTVSFPSGNVRAVLQHDLSGRAGALSQIAPGFSRDRLAPGCPIGWIAWMSIGKSAARSRRRPSSGARAIACASMPIFFSFEADETLLPETFRHVGENHFVYATDIPHWDCEFPGKFAANTESQGSLGPDQKQGPVRKRQGALRDLTRSRLISREGVFKNIALDFSCAGRGLLVYETHPARTLKLAKCWRQKSMISPSVACCPDFSSTKTATTSTYE